MDFSAVEIILKDGIAYIDLIVGGNEFASGAIIAGLMASATYLLRAVPRQLLNAIKKHTTTTIELSSNNKSFHTMAVYLAARGIADQSRLLKVGNGRYGDDKNVKELGHGTQVFWLNWYTPVLITSRREDSVSQIVKEFITITKLGRSHKLFNDLLSDIEAEAIDNTVTKYYKFQDGYEQFIGKQPKRKIETIAISEKNVQQLYTTISAFVNNEGWYLKHQVPYQLGILLYGPPGTGKTSLIKAIAAHMNKDICYVNTEIGLADAALRVSNSIIVAEEVDTLSLDARDAGEDDDDPTVTLFKAMDKAILSRVLNALDGLFSNHGRVVIMTTNHIEILDPALLRPGRIDLQLEIGYMCSETFNSLLQRFFPEYTPRHVDMAFSVSPADVQNDIILGLTTDQLINKYGVATELARLG